jgi:hypothetical protein
VERRSTKKVEKIILARHANETSNTKITVHKKNVRI